MGFRLKSRSSAVLAAGLAAGAAVWAARRAGQLGMARAGLPPPPGAPRVLILGAGFGGITTAIELGRLSRDGLDMDVTLVDRGNYHLFTPMLYQVATGLVEPGHVEYPARAIARDYGFRFRQGQIESIDLDRRQVVVGGQALSYDRLVIALGSVTNYFGNASIERCAASLKTVGDAVAIRNRVLEAFERADIETDVAERQRLLTFVVVGGGATGIELVASLTTLIQNGLLPVYPGVDPREVRVILAEAGKGLLNGMDAWMGESARQRLEEKGVEVWLDNPATEVTSEGIAFKDGSVVPSRTVVWAAGVRPSPLTGALPVERGRDGRLVVDTYLRLPACPEVYALGDCAWFPIPEEDGRPAPPNAQTAVRQAPVVAANVVASLQGASLRPFRFASEGSLVALGQGDGLAQIGTRRIEGFPAWLVWRGYYLTQLMGFKNRLGVLVEWTSAYFGHRAMARLDIGTSAGLGAGAVPAGPPESSQAAPQRGARTGTQPDAPLADPASAADAAPSAPSAVPSSEASVSAGKRASARVSRKPSPSTTGSTAAKRPTTRRRKSGGPAASPTTGEVPGSATDLPQPGAEADAV